MRIFSFGGGVQSTAALVLSAQDKLPYKTFVFANVGEDSENPDTLEYIKQHSKPYAKDHGLDIVEVFKKGEYDEPLTLRRFIEESQTTVPIPMRMSNGSPGNRTCTERFKIRVVAKWLWKNGANKHNRAYVGIGISTDEIHRMRDSGVYMRVNEYPLIDLGLSREDCVRIVTDAGLPEPPKSACYFCPYMRNSDWRKMLKSRPDLFQKALEVEQIVNKRRDALGKDHVYLTRFNKPLNEAIKEQDPDLDLDNCESGYCMT